MKALISLVALCSMTATAMLSSYPAHAATRLEICRKTLTDNGVALNDIAAVDGYCYDTRRCPEMHEALDLPQSTWGTSIPSLSYSSASASASASGSVDNAAIAKAAAAKDAACNACTSGGKPLCVSQ